MRQLSICYKALYLVAAQIVAYLLHWRLEKRNIWLFSEKKMEARDNGYHFFKYICQNHPEIDAYYVIKKRGADIDKVKVVGPVIWYDSFKHCVYYYVSKVRACSQGHGAIPFEEHSGLQRIHIYRRKGQLHINLKHGITKDNQDSLANLKECTDLIISAAKPEYEFIKNTFHYEDKHIVLSGFCRFDALHNLPAPKKQILVMPTFREWLRTSDSSKPIASEDEVTKFKNSSFYTFYKNLLTNKSFLEIIRSNDYSICFYLHYTLQPYTCVFDPFGTDVVRIANRNEDDVQTLLKESALLITDYSSTFFDFAYMHKPVVYAQFDKSEYRARHYKQGFFEYERDGFGPVCMDLKETIEAVDSIIGDGCKLDKEYQKKVNAFFIPYDNQNCMRVYEAIMKLYKA